MREPAGLGQASGGQLPRRDEISAGDRSGYPSRLGTCKCPPAGADRGTMRCAVSETMTVSQHRWSRAEYDRAIEAGVFGPDARLELIEGAILAMGPQGSEHFTGIELVVDALRVAFGAGYRVRTQGPLAAGEDSEPEPDVAVVAGDARSYRDAHPTSALLVVEVSDHSLHRDRTVKQRLYARCGIPEYWILALPERRLETGATSGDLPRPGGRRLPIGLDPSGRRGGRSPRPSRRGHRRRRSASLIRPK